MLLTRTTKRFFQSDIKKIIMQAVDSMELSQQNQRKVCKQYMTPIAMKYGDADGLKSASESSVVRHAKENDIDEVFTKALLRKLKQIKARENRRKQKASVDSSKSSTRKAENQSGESALKKSAEVKAVDSSTQNTVGSNEELTDGNQPTKTANASESRTKPTSEQKPCEEDVKSGCKNSEQSPDSSNSPPVSESTPDKDEDSEPTASFDPFFFKIDNFSLDKQKTIVQKLRQGCVIVPESRTWLVPTLTDGLLESVTLIDCPLMHCKSSPSDRQKVDELLTAYNININTSK